MTGSESSGDGEIFDADAGRRQTHAHTVAAAAGAGRPASSRAAVDDSAGAAGADELVWTCGRRRTSFDGAVMFANQQELWRTTLPSKTTYKPA